MAFKNKQSNVIPLPKEMAQEKKRVLSEIERLGIEQGKARKELADLQAQRKTIEDLSKVIEGLKTTIKVDEDYLASIKNRITDKEKALTVLEKEYIDKKKELEKRYGENRYYLGQEGIKVEKEYKRRLEEVEMLATETEALKSVKNGFLEEIDYAKEEIESLKREINELKNIVDGLEVKKAMVNELENKIDILMGKKEEAGKEIAVLTDKIAKLDVEFAKKQTEFDKFNAEKDRIMTDFNEKMEKREIALNEREGEISEKTQWIETKEEDLRKAKAELEKFYNRKIKHVII